MSYDDNDKPLYSLDDEEAPLYNLDENDDPGSGQPEDDPEDDYPEDDDEEEEEEESVVEEEDKRPSPVKILFKTMFTPVEGWKALKRAGFKTDEFASRCFYPILALAAISDVASMFYEANVTFADWAMQGLSTFIMFFFGYFTVLFLGGFILPKRSRGILKKEIGKQFVMLSMSTLALFWILIQLLPMLEPVLVFLPLWTIYLVFKGVKILRVPDDVKASTVGLLCMLIIGMPLLWNWLFSDLLFPSGAAL